MYCSNDPFLYVAMSGVTDGIAIILATPLAMRFGRRLLLIIFYSASGVLLLLDIAIPAGENSVEAYCSDACFIRVQPHSYVLYSLFQKRSGLSGYW